MKLFLFCKKLLKPSSNFAGSSQFPVFFLNFRRRTTFDYALLFHARTQLLTFFNLPPPLSGVLCVCAAFFEKRKTTDSLFLPPPKKKFHEVVLSFRWLFFSIIRMAWNEINHSEKLTHFLLIGCGRNKIWVLDGEKGFLINWPGARVVTERARKREKDRKRERERESGRCKFERSFNFFHVLQKTRVAPKSRGRRNSSHSLSFLSYSLP